MVTPSENDQITHPLQIARQGAKVGALAVVPGLIVGSISGSLRSKTPRLFTAVTCAQWFTAGATFWMIRSSLLDQAGLQNWYYQSRGAPLVPRPAEPPTGSDRIRASAISGGITGGTVGLLFRGPRNVVPGMIMFTIFGYTGQQAYEWFNGRHSRKLRKEALAAQAKEENLNWLQRFAKKSWSPMSILTDEQYEELLNEKLLKLEVEIALIDDKIKELRSMPKDQKKEEAPADSQQKERK